MRTLAVETTTHGRVLVDGPAEGARIALVGFHGYAQSADDMMSELVAIPGSGSRISAAAQALHRFYARGDQKIVASWMTRQDRDDAIADNIRYIDHVIAEAVPADTAVVVAGFSQGAAMAYRAGLFGKRPVAGIVAIGGDIPPDCKTVAADRWPRVLVAAGRADHWFTSEKADADEAWLNQHSVDHQMLRYDAAHVITDEVRSAIAQFVGRISS